MLCPKITCTVLAKKTSARLRELPTVLGASSRSLADVFLANTVNVSQNECLSPNIIFVIILGFNLVSGTTLRQCRLGDYDVGQLFSNTSVNYFCDNIRWQ